MTSAELKLLIDANYPNNTAGLITPAKERQVLKALVDYVNSSQGEADPIDFIYNPAFTYSAGDPVISGSAWYLSLVDDNLGNDPATNPTEWEPINAQNNVLSIYEADSVYLGLLSIVVKDGALYLLDREVVGDSPFLSSDFDAEVTANQWLPLLSDSSPLLASYADIAAMIAAQGSQISGYFYKAGTSLYIYLGTTVGDLTDYFAVGSGGSGGLDDFPASDGKVYGIKNQEPYEIVDAPVGRRVEEVELIVNNTTSGDLLIARWYNDANVFREILALPLTFIGAPSAGNFRWDLGFGNADGSYSQGNGTEGAEALKPDTPAGAVVLYEILWNSAGEAVTNPNPGGGGGTASVFPTARYATAVSADTTGKYAKIMEINLSKAQDYSFTLDYGSPGTLEKNKAGRVHVAFVCTDAKIIHGITVTIQTVGFSEAGDFVLVQLAGNKAALFHKSTNYWMRLQWRVTFMNSAVKASDFINNGVYGTLAAGTNWQSEVYAPALKTLNGNSLLGSGNLDLDPDYVASTGNILFDVKRKYGFTTAVTGNLTCGITDAREDVVAKVRHNAGTEPTVSGPGGVTIVKDGGTYVPSTDNTLYLVAHKNDAGTVFKITYMIAK